MSRFRVWEANRRVFLYPENYIEPELRDDKTEFFQELEDELLQNNHHRRRRGHGAQPTTSRDERGLQPGDRRLVRRGGLAGRQRRPARGGPNPLRAANVLLPHVHRASRCPTGPGTPGSRSPSTSRPTWSRPWSSTGTSTSTGRTISVKQRPDPPEDRPTASRSQSTATTSRTSTTRRTSAEIKLMGTEYIPSQNKWLKPTLSKARAIDEDAPSPFENEVGEILPSTDNYHLRVSAVGKDFVSIAAHQDPHAGAPTTRQSACGSQASIRRVLRPGLPVRPTVKTRRSDIPHDQISPALLGTFQFWYTGENTFESPTDDADVALALGQELAGRHRPQAQRSRPGDDFTVEGQIAKDELELEDQRAVLPEHALSVPGVRHELRLHRPRRTSRSSTRPPRRACSR